MKRYLLLSALALVGSFMFAAVQAEAADWAMLHTSVTDEFAQISCPDARTCYIASGFYMMGGSGGIMKTTDGGETFAALALPSSNPLHGISCPTTKTCYAAGDFGTFLKTTDGGTSWTESSLGNRANPPRMTAVFATDERNVVVVGKDGFVNRTEDGGATWSPPSLRTVADLTSVYFVNSSTGFILGNGGVLLASTDGGQTWTARGDLRTGGSLFALRGNGQTLFAVGDTVSRSADGGASWAEVSTGAASGYRGVAAASDKTAYLLSDPNLALTTTDAGANFASQTLPGNNTILHDIACPTPDYCIAIGSNGNAFRLGTPPAPLPPPPPPTPPAPVVPITSPVVAAVAAAIPTAPAIEPVAEEEIPEPSLPRTLKRGAKGAEVRVLQELLAGVGGGLFSTKDINGLFGPLTAKAVGKFQVQYNVAKPGVAGYGDAGPKTRAKLISTFIAKKKSAAKP